jgi:hypothetical protein
MAYDPTTNPSNIPDPTGAIINVALVVALIIHLWTTSGGEPTYLAVNICTVMVASHYAHRSMRGR